MKQTVTCIICPIGCEIKVTGKGKDIDKVEGYECKKGIQYAIDEFIDPRRILTTTVKIKGSRLPVIPVRSDKPLPKNLLFRCMDILKEVIVEAPTEMGQIVFENILNTGVNIITTSYSES